MNTDISKNIDSIVNEVGINSPVIVKHFLIGHKKTFNAAIIYVNGLANKDVIDRSILKPLMFQVNEELIPSENTIEYICKRYIPLSNT